MACFQPFGSHLGKPFGDVPFMACFQWPFGDVPFMACFRRQQSRTTVFCKKDFAKTFPSDRRKPIYHYDINSGCISHPLFQTVEEPDFASSKNRVLLRIYEIHEKNE